MDNILFNHPVNSFKESASAYLENSSKEDDILLREQVMSSTVSVDEYFDELISQVRKDYASL